VRNWIAPALLIALLSAPVLDPAVQLYYRDTGRFQYPVKKILSEGLRRGELRFWNSWSEAGQSLTGQLDAALWHPTSLLYTVLPLDWAFKLQHLSALLLALLGMYALARRLSASREAAAAAAAAFCGSGFLVSMVSSNLLFALGLAAMPLALERLLAFLETRRPLTLLCGAAALASCTLGGDAQAMLFAGYIGLGGALRWGLRRGKAIEAFALTALWGTCALLLSLPAVLPVLPHFTNSSRSAGRLNPLDDFALRPLRLAGVALPWAFDDAVEEGQPSTYTEYLRGLEPDAFADSITLGIPVLLLAFASGKRGRPALLAAAALLVCACGEALGAGKPFFALLPGLQLFRYPEKLVAPATLLLCAAAALGADAATREPRKFARIALGVAALLAALALAAPFLTPHGRTGATDLAARFAFKLRASCMVEALLCALLAFAVRRPVWLAPLCALASFLAIRGVIAVAPIEALQGPFPLAAQLESLDGKSSGRWRIFTEGDTVFQLADVDPRIAMTVGGTRSLLPNYNLLAGIESVVPYSALFDLDYGRAWSEAPRAMVLLFGVRFVLRPPQTAELPGYTRGPYGILEKRWPEQPRAFLLPCARIEHDPANLARELARPAFDPHHAAYLRKPVALPESCATAAVPVEVSRPKPEEMSFDVSAAAPSLLIVAEHFEAGWRALVDGVPAEVLQVDLCAQGLVLPAGAHRVEMRFSPPYLGPGFLLALLCAATLLLLDFRFRARARSGPDALPAAAPAASETSAPLQ
jgi:hypothetical protein